MKFGKDETVLCSDGKEIAIRDFLGEGGQGEVYLAEYNGKQYAFKYYKGARSSEFMYNLKTNIARGRPSDTFLWPQEIVETASGGQGYLMALRPKNYVSFVSYLTGKNSFADREVLLRWCIRLCESFKKLHEKGFSYQDLNDGSFFLDPHTGSLLICDNDNVTADKKSLGILGKMRYMAPEIVRGDLDEKGAKRMPDVHSDRFSLAVILFLALCKGNPFEGEVLKNFEIVDEAAEYHMFGVKPIFVFHKTNLKNRPIRGYHSAVLKRWPLLPEYIQEGFARTFTDGLVDRENGRVTELEWLKLFTRYRDELIGCACGEQVAYLQAKNRRCPACGGDLEKTCVLQIGKNRICLVPGKKLYAVHLDKYSSEYDRPVAEVIRNKNNPSLWGIRLELSAPVAVKDSHGAIRTVAADGVIPLIKDLKIQFDQNTEGVITI